MHQNIIAFLYDFDHTLSPEYMQEAIFNRFGLDGKAFWEEKEELIKKAQTQGVHLDQECAYMNLLIGYVKQGRIPKLSNKDLYTFGRELPLFAGLPNLFAHLKQSLPADEKFRALNLSVEHYVISSGLKVMIEGSALGNVVTEVFGSEFMEDENGNIASIARAIGYTKKTEFIHLINKGGNIDPHIDLNGTMPREVRRVPFQNMIYTGDGPTDVPCFAILNKRQGISIAVYNPSSPAAFERAYLLREQGRVFDFGPADYSFESHTAKMLEYSARKIAERMLLVQEQRLKDGSTSGPRHG